MQHDDIVLDVRRVTKIFGGDRDRTLQLIAQGATKAEIQEQTGAVVGVRDASFTVRRGEFFVIMGLSGSGKSTLVRCLIRLVEPSSGQIFIDGQDITQLSDADLREVRRHKTAMVFQHYGLLPHKTVLENAAYGLKTRGVPKEEREQAARAAIERVGLKGWEDYRPRALSGGMQQRVGLARALAHNPDLLLMDEPFSGLDPLIRKQLRREFAAMQEEAGLTTILVTHDLDEALTLGDRIAVMRDGQIIQIATPDELITNPADAYVASFVEGASASRFLTAAQIMDRDVTTVSAADDTDAVRRLLQSRSARSAFVINGNGTVRGLIPSEDLSRISSNGDRRAWETAVRQAVTAEQDTPLPDLVPLALKSRYPLGVVDHAGRLVGQITKNALLKVLADDIEADEGSTPDARQPNTRDGATHVERVS